jgi:hypothetical protein
MSRVTAPGLPEAAIRERARRGRAAAFPPVDDYGTTVYGATPELPGGDPLDSLRLVPPVFMPRRLDKLTQFGREPLDTDVLLETPIGGLTSRLPVFVAAFGSTRVAGTDLGLAAARQAGRLGIPIVLGENIVPMNGYGRVADGAPSTLRSRIAAYVETCDGDGGGVVVQQSTEDADAEVWNLVYSDPAIEPLLASGRLAFELKVGQGAKPGLGGMTVVDPASAERLQGRYAFHDIYRDATPALLRCSAPGTFTAEILRQQVRLLRNNFPRCRIWVKLPPARDLRDAATVAWNAGADAVTVDGGEGGTGWAPSAFLKHVGLPLAECLARIGDSDRCLLATGRIWEGTRAVKCLALGATAVGLGRAALVAVDEDAENGLVRLVDSIALEIGLLVSALGKYAPADLGSEDLWPSDADHAAASPEHRRRLQLADAAGA